MSNKVKEFEKLDTITVDPRHDNPTEFVKRLPITMATNHRRLQVRLDHLPLDTPKKEGHTRFVCISDTHGLHRELRNPVPPGDVLLHSGDFTDHGRPEEIDDFNDWLGELPHKYKIVIAGNHELSFDPRLYEASHKYKRDGSYCRFRFLSNYPEEEMREYPKKLTNCVYLHDQEITVMGHRIYGTPWNPEFGGWAFNLERGQALLDKWNKIPEGIDVLMTHCPPAGQLDKVPQEYGDDERVGCVDLLNTVQLRVKPKFHVFGHIHEGYGYNSDGYHRYINCSLLNNKYRVCSNKPIIFDLPTPEGAKEVCGEIIQH